MKKMLLVFLIFGLALALNPTSYNHIPVDGQKISGTGLKGNFDSLKSGVNQCKDTLNKTVPRMIMFRNHDSTFNWMNIDTLPSVDTIYAKSAKISKMDSVHFTAGISASIFNGPLNGNVTGNVTGSSGSCTGNAVTATTATNLSGTGTVTATVINADSIFIQNGIKMNSAGTIEGYNIKAVHDLRINTTAYDDSAQAYANGVRPGDVWMKADRILRVMY